MVAMTVLLELLIMLAFFLSGTAGIYFLLSPLGGKSQSLHSDIGIYFFHECNHPISYLKKDFTLVGNNVYPLDTPLYVFDSGNLFFINQASST